MKYQYSAKLVFIGALDALPQDIRDGFAQQVAMFALSDQSGEVMCTDDAGTTEVLRNPLTGPVVMVLNGDSDTDLAARATAVWTDAKLPAPTQITLTGTDDARTVTLALLVIQGAFVREAALRNVAMMQQIAALRQQSEDLNIALTQAFEATATRDGGARKLLHCGVASGAGISLAPGASVSQRLPITLMPTRIGGLAFFTSNTAAAAVSLRLRAVELETDLETHSFDLAAGQSMTRVALTTLIGANARLVDVILTNTGDAPVTLDTALCEAPEERARVDGKMDDAMLHSVRLDLYSRLTTGSQPFGLIGETYLSKLSPYWLAAFRKHTPKHDNKNWLMPLNKDQLLVHPLPDVPAIAGVGPLPYSGTATKISLLAQTRDKSESTVYVRLTVTSAALPIDQVDHASRYAISGPDAGDAELARSDWVAIPPDTERQVSLDLPHVPAGQCHLNVITFTKGASTVHAHLIVSDITLLTD